MTTTVTKVEQSARELLELLEAAHAVVRTWNVDDETSDIALEEPAVVKMLHGVDVLLELAENAAERVSRHPQEGVADEWQHGNLPEEYMFQSVSVTTINTDIVTTACCRARGVIHLMVTNAVGGKFSLPAEHDASNVYWAIEGMIAQAIAAMTLLYPTRVPERHELVIKAQREAKAA